MIDVVSNTLIAKASVIVVWIALDTAICFNGTLTGSEFATATNATMMNVPFIV
jgi:hypothetical protein